MPKFAIAIAILLVSARASAESRALCGGAASVTRDTASSPWSLAVGGAQTLLGAGDLELRAVGPLVLLRGAEDPSGPGWSAVVRCGPGPVARVAEGRERWVGEDVGQRRREALSVATVAGVERVLRVTYDEGRRLCGVGYAVAETAWFDPATSRWVEARVSLGGALPRAEGEATVTAARDASGLVAPVALRGYQDATGREAVAVGPRLDQDGARGVALGAGSVISFELPVGVGLEGVDLGLQRAGGDPLRLAVFTEPGSGPRDATVGSTALAEGRGVVRLAWPGVEAARCVALRFGSAVTLSRLALRTSLDADGPRAFERLAQEASTPQGEGALRLLLSLGPEALAALRARVPEMPTPARRRALRLLAGHRDPETLALMVAALANDETRDAALAALQAAGPQAVTALGASLGENPAAAGALAALHVPIEARAMALLRGLSADDAAWRATRGALERVLPGLVTTPHFEAWLAALPSDDPRAETRGLRVAAESLTPGTASTPTLGQRALRYFTQEAAFEMRYRALAALPFSPEGVTRLQALVTDDDDDDLRAEAARVLGRSGAGDAALLRALGADPVPRVRAAAAAALAGRAGATAGLVEALGRDRWPSTRVAAASALAGASGAASGLLGALSDRNVGVVRAALHALGQTPGPEVTGRLVAWAEDGRHNPELRRDAVDAAGNHCDASALGPLERLLESTSDPSLPPYELEVGEAALAAIARIDVARARAWIARNGSNAAAASAVERSSRRACAVR